MPRFAAYLALALLAGACSSVLGETGCPDAEAISPCRCIKKPLPCLICENVTRREVLLEVFRESERYTYQEVHVIDSVFPYFPVKVLTKTTVKELYFRNSVFYGLFEYGDQETQYQHPYKIRADGVKLLRGLKSSNFTSFTNLSELTLNFTLLRLPIPNLSRMLPKSIKRLELQGTTSMEIHSGGLSGLPNLDKFVAKSGNLKSLNRTIFSSPFDGRILNFDDNKIESIPDDMFTEMPNLQFLSMRNNIISTIPEAAFNGRQLNVPVFRFGGNPLVCDCQILWIIQDKPIILEGDCASPDAFKGKELRKINPTQFQC